MDILLLIQVLTTAFMTGLIWFVQVVHYPLFSFVGSKFFVEYEAQHVQLTTWVVAPPMLLELVLAVYFLFQKTFSPGLVLLSYINFALVGIIWVSTMFVQVRQHNALEAGFNAQIAEALVSGNWIRTVAWSVKIVIVAVMYHKYVKNGVGL